MFSLFFRPLFIIFYAVLAGLALLPSLASALMFQSSADTAAPAPKGINRTPPPIPVMTPAEFQGKVQSLGEETRQNMIQQGAADIKQQKDILPQEEPVPPPLSAKPPAAGDIPSATTAAPASPPPTESSASPMPDTLPSGEEPSAAGENSTPDTYTGFSAGSAPASGSGPASSGGNSGGFGLKY